MPNIIFLLADDLGYDDIGYGNNIIQTPAINKLYNEGQVLKWYYGQNLCTPTRTAIMTGLYPLHNQINNVIMANYSYAVPLNYTFFPKIFYENGWDTHIIGKWHLGYYKWEYTPTFRGGFKSFYGYYNGDEDYYNHSCQQQGYYDFHDELGRYCGSNCSRVVTEAVGIYSNYLYTQRAIDIIHNNSLTDEPLFLYLPFQSVHGPHEVPLQYIQRYVNITNNTNYNLYLGMVTIMDESIGNITNVLNKYGYLNNKNGSTLIIFSSDNGSPHCTQCGYNTPLRGCKTTVWEGGCRLSAAIWATNDIIPNNKKGTEYTQLMHVVDWFPTLLECANINITKLNLNYSLDGVSQWKGLINTNSNNMSDEYFEYRDNIWYNYATTIDNLYFVGFNNTAYRYKWNKIINGSGSINGKKDGHYKPDLNEIYIYLNDNEEMYQFYDLKTDPNEYNNIINESINNNQTFLNILNKMIELENTAKPQMINDDNCPPFKPQNNSIVGSVYMPWC